MRTKSGDNATRMRRGEFIALPHEPHVASKRAAYDERRVGIGPALIAGSRRHRYNGGAAKGAYTNGWFGITKESILMKRVGFILLTLSVFLVLSAVSYAARGPIVILGNSDFTEENGVVSGEGTATNPYIIIGHEIDAEPDQRYGVRIENVTASFVLRGLHVNGVTHADGAAIRIGFSSGGVIEACTIADSVNGIELVSSTDIAIRESMIYVSGRGLRVEGETAEEYRHEIEATVLLNDVQVLYYYDVDGRTIDGKTTRHMTVANSENVTITGNDFSNGDGLHLAFVTDSTITANTAGRSVNIMTGHAIELFNSDRNELTFNFLRNSRLAGVQLTLSSENRITGNYFAVNDTGLRLIASDGNTIDENSFLGCYTALWLSGGSSSNRVAGNVVVGQSEKDGDRRNGLNIELAFGNEITGNAITDCEIGIDISPQGGDNDFLSNSIVSCSYGISLSGSNNTFEGNLFARSTRGLIFPETYGNTITRGNAVLRNVFSANATHVYTNLDSEGNTFARNLFLGDASARVADNGTGNRWTLDTAGNYWGDAVLADEDADGIGDSPVMIYPSGVQDEAPFIDSASAGAGIGILGALESSATQITTLDGVVVVLETLIADGTGERAIGFQGFPKLLLEDHPGILFIFDHENEGAFHMNNVGFDLDIAFFDGDGTLVGNALMTANSEDLYSTSVPYRYALEVPAGMLDELGIGADSTLTVP